MRVLAVGIPETEILLLRLEAAWSDLSAAELIFFRC
jgi:hypothetical protein